MRQRRLLMRQRRLLMRHRRLLLVPMIILYLAASKSVLWSAWILVSRGQSDMPHLRALRCVSELPQKEAATVRIEVYSEARPHGGCAAAGRMDRFAGGVTLQLGGSGDPGSTDVLLPPYVGVRSSWLVATSTCGCLASVWRTLHNFAVARRTCSIFSVVLEANTVAGCTPRLLLGYLRTDSAPLS
jgi:hypothetical protein